MGAGMPPFLHCTLCSVKRTDSPIHVCTLPTQPNKNLNLSSSSSLAWIPWVCSSLLYRTISLPSSTRLFTIPSTPSPHSPPVLPSQLSNHNQTSPYHHQQFANSSILSYHYQSSFCTLDTIISRASILYLALSAPLP